MNEQYLTIDKQPEPKGYLGDGAYVRHDGHNLILTVEDGIQVNHCICLEPEVWTALKRFAEQITASQQPNPSAEIPESVLPLIQEYRHKAKVFTAAGEWMARNSGALAGLAEIGIRPTYYGYSVDFDWLSHEKVMAVVKAFPGKWKKELNYGQQDKIDYSITFDGLEIRCGAGEPPPSCRIIEEEVEVPATKRIVRRLECSPAIGEAEPAA